MSDDTTFSSVRQAFADLKAEVEFLHDIRLGGVVGESLDQLKDLLLAHSLTLPVPEDYFNPLASPRSTFKESHNALMNIPQAGS